MKLQTKNGFNLANLKAAALLTTAVMATSATAEVVFDGSIGNVPAGTLRSGDFVIAETDGQLSGTNLFHSFERFNVNTGESATFTYNNQSLTNIISRVTGETGTAIQGGLSVQLLTGEPELVTASLWLINPSGIVIGENAMLDPSNVYRLSSANEISFSNGDAFYSHDVTNSSTLSIASPEAFGFLAGNPLPSAITPGTVSVGAVSSQGNGPLLNGADIALVGSNTDSSLTGLSVGENAELGTGLIARRLNLHSLGPGGQVAITSPLSSGPATLASIGSALELTNTTLLVGDGGLDLEPSPVSISGGNLFLSGNTIGVESDAISTELNLNASGQLVLFDTFLNTTTIGDNPAGDLLINAESISATASFFTSVSPDLSNGNVADGLQSAIALGDAGSIRLTAGAGGIELINSSVASSALAQSNAGQISIESPGDISLLATQTSNEINIVSTGPENLDDITIAAGGSLSIQGPHFINASTITEGDAGDIVLTADSITLNEVADGSPITLNASSINDGTAGQIRISAQNGLIIQDTALQSVATEGAGATGSIALSATDLSIANSLLFISGVSNNPNDAPGFITLTTTGSIVADNVTAQGNTGDLAPAGQIILSAEDSILLNQIDFATGNASNAGLPGMISINAGNDLVLQGDRSQILTNNQGVGDAGDISLIAQDILLFEGYTIQTSAENGNAGTVQFEANRFFAQRGEIGSLAEAGGGGDISIFSDEITLIGNNGILNFANLNTDSFSSDADGNGGSVTLGNPADPASRILVQNTFFSASAEQGNGGQINVNADSFLRDSSSVFLLTSESGNAGTLAINAPQQDISGSIVELSAPLLDQTELIQNLCNQSAGTQSSLVIESNSTPRFPPDGYFTGWREEQTTATEAGFGCAQ